jgi:hypothetical protein
MSASALRGALKVMNSLRGKKVCYLTVELLELVDESISLKRSIEGDELLEGEVRVCLLNIHPWR